MPNQILQVDENMLETKLDRLVLEKVEQLLNAMLDAEADEITGACRRSYTLECKTNAARRALEGEPLARVARDAGCTPTSVYQWMRRYRSEGILGLMDRRNAPMPAEPMPAAGDDVEELRRQVEVLRLENAVMRETIDVLKADDPRLDPSMLTNRERTRVVDAIRGEFGLEACLKAVGLKRRPTITSAARSPRATGTPCCGPASPACSSRVGAHGDTGPSTACCALTSPTRSSSRRRSSGGSCARGPCGPCT